jgi:hypothetical protein
MSNNLINTSSTSYLDCLWLGQAVRCWTLIGENSMTKVSFREGRVVRCKTSCREDGPVVSLQHCVPSAAHRLR